ncbi:hypothetical protein ACWT_1230 [Actinoplanes sp. SE50]|uniref:hypothetical protein n=1 Tax=unclassified Actinoplanes TaxID=2626549 RepID=UPI00023ED3B3|nr:MULTISPECIES: hypothetical protein [unclassified Actinoplanes]AEV82247.1 hypothetical protein ACPL_1350 [Actinoplanes sp. SE50/110]ATO80645.1 hypothetical protein ACWT_1230 [Actinoplanes sp. SE50]SLL98052.1 hypothetical protein ACSP50_1269 [Actinoplanes sp. SE50/110]
MTHNDEGGPEDRSSGEFTLRRPLFVLTSETVRPAGRHRPSEKPGVSSSWAGFIAPTGIAPHCTGRAGSAAAADGGGTGGHAPARSLRRPVAVAAGVATAVAVGLIILVPDHDRGAPSATGDGRNGIVVDGPSAMVSTPPGAGTELPGAGSEPATTPASPQPHATQLRKVSSSAAARTPEASRFVAVAGESCPQSADRGYHVSGQASDWYFPSRGGWTSDGCGGRVAAVPMSGSPTRDDRDNVIVWWFRTGTVRTGSCAVGVYVPGTGNPKDAAGEPAHYLLRADDDIDADVVAEFDVDQSANQGRWVDAGRYSVTSGEISVQLVTRGVDWGSGREGDHLGVSALRADCRAE